MFTAKRVAGIITTLWVIGVGIMIYHSESALAQLRLNELGDFLAGVFAPIAFVWLVVAVWIQSAELKEQRAELALTREEFKNQRDVMEAQAAESKKQAQYIGTQTKLLEIEEQRRIFAEEDDYFDSQLRFLVSLFGQHPDALDISHEKSSDFRIELSHYASYETLEPFCRKLKKDVDEFVEKTDVTGFGFYDAIGFDEIQQQLTAIVSHMPQLSPAMNLFARRYGFDHGLSAIEELEHLTWRHS